MLSKEVRQRQTSQNLTLMWNIENKQKTHGTDGWMNWVK